MNQNSYTYYSWIPSITKHDFFPPVYLPGYIVLMNFSFEIQPNSLLSFFEPICYLAFIHQGCLHLDPVQ